MLVPCSSALFQTSISLPWQVQMCPSALEGARLRQSHTVTVLINRWSHGWRFAPYPHAKTQHCSYLLYQC